MRLFLFIFLLTSLSFAPLAAKEKKLPEDPLLIKAQKGDPESCFALGNEFYYGEKRKLNYTLAAFWYRKAAEKGLPEAMYNFAICLEGGFGVDKNVEKAIHWYRRSMEKGFDTARYRIANMYLAGVKDEKGKVILKRSPASALEHLEILNIREYGDGELALARLFLDPKASYARKVRAFTILQKVAARKNPSPAAFRMLADCYYGGYGVKVDPVYAGKLLEKAVRLGDGEAMAKLGFLYERGEGGKKQDLEKAFSCYEMAAGKDHPMALFKMAEALFEGKIRREKIKLRDILKLYERSAAGDCPQAMFKLGVIYYEGLRGLPKNPGIAARCFYEGARLGYVPCMYNFGCLFETGEGVRKDPAAAFYWFRRAAEEGHVASMRKAGIALMRGEGTNQDVIQARNLLRMAAERGDPAAARILGE